MFWSVFSTFEIFGVKLYAVSYLMPLKANMTIATCTFPTKGILNMESVFLLVLVTYCTISHWIIWRHIRKRKPVLQKTVLDILQADFTILFGKFYEQNRTHKIYWHILRNLCLRLNVMLIMSSSYTYTYHCRVKMYTFKNIITIKR